MELPTNRPSYAKESKRATEDGEFRQTHDEKGQEIPDPVPMAPPLGYTKPLSMFDTMRAQIRAEHNRIRQLELEGLEETVEDANDFDVDEDLEEQPSLYEEKFDPVDFEVRNRLRQAEFRASYEDRVNSLPDNQKELLSGDTLRRKERSASYEGREDDPPRRDREQVERDEDRSGEVKEPSVSGSVRSRDQGDKSGKREDQKR